MTSFSEQRLREMRAAGSTMVEIAEELGITQSQVREMCETLGIPSAVMTKVSWQDSARNSSAMLVGAIRRHHPDRVGVRSL